MSENRYRSCLLLFPERNESSWASVESIRYTAILDHAARFTASDCASREQHPSQEYIRGTCSDEGADVVTVPIPADFLCD